MPVHQGSEGVHSSASKHQPWSATKKDQACAARAAHIYVSLAFTFSVPLASVATHVHTVRVTQALGL